MKPRRWLSMLLALVMILSMIPASVFAADGTDGEKYQIVIGENATEMQEYAAKELRKYLYQLTDVDVPVVTATEGMDLTNSFVVGTRACNPLVSAVQTELDSLAATGAEGHEGEQGYVLKKVDSTLYIAGTDDAGALYGVYGLLDDYYGIGFYFSGDAIPENYTGPMMPEVDEAKTPPAVYARRPALDQFPQSATVYSLEDWTHIIDQMARMRMNFLNIHNYNGFPSRPPHNELFHNFTYNGITSRQWNATAATGHGWYMPGWDVNQYRFGATDLFDDYDFGADATLHNDNLEVFAKGYTEFQYIIDYAHSRGVKMGLGIDADVIMSDYGVGPAAEDVPETQARTIAENYPDLDVLIIYKAEGLGSEADWKQVVERVDTTLKADKSTIRVAISGWGVSKDMADWAKTIDENIIVAPIANYQPDFEDETTYEGLEYWAGPWMEKDFNSSVYFYPFNFDLQQLIDCYQRNKDGMEGMFTLSWRLTDAVDAKIGYIAKAPWDLENKYTAAEDVYGEYVEKCYGVGLDDATKADLTQLICNDEKTVIPTLWSECQGTVDFTQSDRSADIASLQSMIDRVDAALKKVTDTGCAERLNKLRYRLVCAQTYCKLDQDFYKTDWAHLQDDFSVWAQSFMKRVDDISSLGNNVSAQNRFVQQRYVARETALRNQQTTKAPLNVVAKGTYNGAVLTWEYENNAADGFNVYRDGTKLNAEPLSGGARNFTDTYNGTAVYTVTAIVNGEEGTASIPQTCDAGSADTTAPQAIVVSPSTSAQAGQDLKVKARLLDGRDYSELRAVIHYRALGSDGAFTVAPMEHRTKATFTFNLDTAAFADTGIEYYLTVSDGKNQGVWPVTGGEDGLNAACTVYGEEAAAPAAPTNVEAVNGVLTWDGVAGAHWYRIYRDTNPDFTPSMANYVTYVAGSTTEFQDVATGFDGKSLADETWYYRITAVDAAMNESEPSEASNAVNMEETPVNPLTDTSFIEADELVNSQVSDQVGSSNGKAVGFIKAPGYAKFEALTFAGEDSGISFNAVDVAYATQTSGGALEIRLDSSDGEVIGSATLPSTGSWGEGGFKTVTIELDPAVTGTHDVYFVYKSDSTGYLYNLDYFRFKYVPDETDPPVVHEGTTITTNDMMASRGTTSSGMMETLSAVVDFGYEGDRIVLGKGYRADAGNAVEGGGTSVVDLPGYEPMKCFAGFGAKGTYFGFTDLPAGHAYLAYDKWGNESDGLSVYVGDGQTPAATLTPGSSGSNWDTPPHKIMYLDTKIDLTDGQSIKFQNDVDNTGNTTKAMNGVKLFVEQEYTAQQLDITYSNNATTQYSLYVNGTDTGKNIVFPNSDGVEKTVYVPGEVTGLIELRVDKGDLEANGTAKTTIYNVLLCDKEYGAPEADTNTVTVTVGENGTVEAVNNEIVEGVVTVETGSNQSFRITPASGYRVDQVIVNGVNVGAVRNYTFQQLNYDATLKVTFAEDVVVTVPKYDIQVAPTEHGRITPAKARAEEGETINLDVVPEDGYQLKKGTLKVNGTAIDETAARFTMPAEDVTITAEFEYIGSSGGGSSSSSSYTITVTQTAGGKISPSTTSVKKGSDKTFTITANEGYKIADVLVDGKSVGAVSTYTFENVTARHTITAKFEKVEEITNVGGFTDVKSNDWFAEAVQYAVDNGLMNGTSSDKFTPNGATTRGMIVTILYRQAGSPEVEGDGATWWSDARVWAMANGVSDGTNMEKPITREQLATMLYRYAELSGKDVSKSTSLDSFKDGSKVSAYAVEALKWAAAEGIVTGKTGGVIDPQAGATRAETATMLMRFCEGNS